MSEGLGGSHRAWQQPISLVPEWLVNIVTVYNTYAKRSSLGHPLQHSKVGFVDKIGVAQVRRLSHPRTVSQIYTCNSCGALVLTVSKAFEGTYTHAHYSRVITPDMPDVGSSMFPFLTVFLER